MTRHSEAQPTYAPVAGRVLIIGVLPGNLGPELEQHDRVEYWQHDVIDRKSVFPPDVDRVFVTRFVSHVRLDRVKRMAKKSDAHVLYHNGNTGVLKVLVWQSLGDRREAHRVGYVAPAPSAAKLGDALSTDALKQVQAVAAPTPTPSYDTLAEFLDARWDWTKTMKVSEQAVQLFGAAKVALNKDWSLVTFKNTTAKWYADRLERRTRPDAPSPPEPESDADIQAAYEAVHAESATTTPTTLKLAARAVATVRRMEATITTAMIREAFGLPPDAEFELERGTAVDELVARWEERS